jgi:hypothetical protein
MLEMIRKKLMMRY